MGACKPSGNWIKRENGMRGLAANGVPCQGVSNRSHG